MADRAFRTLTGTGPLTGLPTGWRCCANYFEWPCFIGTPTPKPRGTPGHPAFASSDGQNGTRREVFKGRPCFCIGWRGPSLCLLGGLHATSQILEAPKSEVRLNQPNEGQRLGMPVLICVRAEVGDDNITLAIDEQQLSGESSLEYLAELAYAVPLITRMTEPIRLLAGFELSLRFFKQCFQEYRWHRRIVRRLSPRREQQTKASEIPQRHPDAAMRDGIAFRVQQEIRIIVGARLAPQHLADELRQRCASEVLKQFGENRGIGAGIELCLAGSRQRLKLARKSYVSTRAPTPASPESVAAIPETLPSDNVCCWDRVCLQGILNAFHSRSHVGDVANTRSCPARYSPATARYCTIGLLRSILPCTSRIPSIVPTKAFVTEKAMCWSEADMCG